MADGTGGGLHAHSRVVWLGMELNGLSPEPPSNTAIPMEAGEILFLILQLSPLTLREGS